MTPILVLEIRGKYLKQEFNYGGGEKVRLKRQV